MRKTRAQVSSSQALHTSFWRGTFRERGYAFSGRMSRGLSLGITVKLSCKWWENMPLWKVVDLGWVTGFGYISNINQFYLAFFYYYYFKDFPAGRNHEKGLGEVLEESSVSPLWSCKSFDYNGTSSVRPKQRGFVPPCTDVQDNPRNPSSKAWKAGNCFDSLMALVPKLP